MGYGRGEKKQTVMQEKPEGKGPLRTPMDSKILIWTLKKQDGAAWHGPELSYSGQEQVACFCEYGNGSSHSTKCRNFHD